MKSLIVLFVAASILYVSAVIMPQSVVASSPQHIGAQAFASCRACHTLQANGKSMMGPNLHKLFGRKAGTVSGYNYSPALKASGIVWDAKSLDQFLTSPTANVPGTRMVVKLADPAKRAALIAYLRAETSKR